MLRHESVLSSLPLATALGGFFRLLPFLFLYPFLEPMIRSTSLGRYRLDFGFAFYSTLGQHTEFESDVPSSRPVRGMRILATHTTRTPPSLDSQCTCLTQPHLALHTCRLCSANPLSFFGPSCYGSGGSLVSGLSCWRPFRANRPWWARCRT